MIKTQNISVQLGGKQLLYQINLSVQQGELMVLLGGNGAGKSTLLKTIAGNLPCVEGFVDLEGKSLDSWTAATLATKRAVLSQNIMLVFPMKVLDVVLLGRYPYSQGILKPTDIKLALELLEVMGLVKFASSDITALSGGEQQRVHLARVLAQVWDSSPQNPKLLLLDEPTSNLDIVYQHVLLKLLLERVQQHGLAVMAVLHDINLAAQYATHIALLKQGKLLTVGSPSESLTTNWIKAAFGVSSVVQAHPIFDCLQVSTY